MGERCVRPSVQRAIDGVRCIFQHIKYRQDLAIRSAMCAEEGLAEFKRTFRYDVDRVVREALDAFGKDVQAAFWETLLATPCDPFDGWMYKRLIVREKACWSPFKVHEDEETSAALATQVPELHGYHVIGSQSKPILGGCDAALEVARCVLFRSNSCGDHNVAICVVVRSRGLHETKARDIAVVALSMYTAGGIVDTAPVSIDAYLGDNEGVVRALLRESGAALGFSTIDAGCRATTTWVPQRGRPEACEAGAARASATKQGLYSADASLDCVMRWTAPGASSYRLVVAVCERGERRYDVWDVRGRGPSSVTTAYKVEHDRVALTMRRPVE
jgi:hypothetical protein